MWSKLNNVTLVDGYVFNPNHSMTLCYSPPRKGHDHDWWKIQHVQLVYLKRLRYFYLHIKVPNLFCVGPQDGCCQSAELHSTVQLSPSCVQLHNSQEVIHTWGERRYRASFSVCWQTQKDQPQSVCVGLQLHWSSRNPQLCGSWQRQEKPPKIPDDALQTGHGRTGEVIVSKYTLRICL